MENGPLTKEYVLKFVDAAIFNNIDHLQILDHSHRFKEFLPIYESYRFSEEQDTWLNARFVNSLQEYVSLMNEVKQMDLPIQLSFGLEICYQKAEEDNIREILKDYSFDFLVGSVHAINYRIHDCAFSKKLLWDVYNINTIYRDYYKEVFACIESGIFTQLGHPDTIKMVHRYPDYDLTETYLQMADLLNQYHVLAENNTGCYYRYQHTDKGLSNHLLQILKEKGCQLITASDAHYPEDIGKYIADIYEITEKQK